MTKNELIAEISRRQVNPHQLTRLVAATVSEVAVRLTNCQAACYDMGISLSNEDKALRDRLTLATDEDIARISEELFVNLMMEKLKRASTAGKLVTNLIGDKIKQIIVDEVGDI